MRHGTIILIGALLALVACDDTKPTGTKPPEQTRQAVIAILANQGVLTELPADGVTNELFRAVATNADGLLDNTPMTISASSGTITAAVGTVTPDGLQLTATPTNGAIDFAYQCELFAAREVTLTASNGVATRTITFTCALPAGTPRITLTDDCDTELIADGQSFCTVTIQVGRYVGTELLRALPAQLEVEVTGVRSVILPDGTFGNDNQGISQTLRTGPAAPRTNLISLNTDGSGAGTFEVVSPELNLQETIDLEVRGATTTGESLPARKSAYRVQPFVNLSSLDMTASPLTVLGGETSTLTITAVNQQGDAAGTTTDPAVVTLETDTPDAELSDAALDVVDGAGTATVTLPILPGSESREIEVTATYQPVDALPPLTATARIFVVPPGTLIINPELSSKTLKSDVPSNDPRSSVELTAWLSKDQQPVTNEVTFEVSTGDRERIGLVDPNTGAIVDTLVITPEADGSATVTVVAKNERVRGRAVVSMSAIDDAEPGDPVSRASAVIQVVRDPLLQAVVFAGANPAQLGVRGSSMPTSSVVSFQVLDDLAEPMQNVVVSFDVPATADPEAGVTSSDVSDANGMVGAIVSSGTRAAPLQVVATAVTDSGSVTVVSDPIPVTAGLPSFSNSWITCDPVIETGAFEAECVATLADRFTNLAPNGALAQFRAEGGDITPYGAADGGQCTATFVSGEPGRSSPDVRVWSYGMVIPMDEFDLSDEQQGGDTFDAAACFDGTTDTPCDLYTMCREGSLPEFCPLPLDPDGSGCWEDFPLIGLELMGVSTGTACTVLTNSPTTGDITITCGTDSLIVPGGEADALTYARNVEVRAAVDELRRAALRCGFPISCLTGKTDPFNYVYGEECSVAKGCFDFDPRTPCPQDGLLTVTATFRGEEAFVDLNGNGIFDFDDANGNGRHEPNETYYEPFADMPEAFVDKQDNCYRDSYADHFRLEPYEEIRHTDVFTDEDDSEDFGYDLGDGGPSAFSNGQWDADKEVLVQSRILHVGEPLLEAGELCSPAEVLTGHTCLDGNSADCEQVGADYGMADCVPPVLVHPSLVARAGSDVAAAAYAGLPSTMDLHYAWMDANANCATPQYIGRVEVTSKTGLYLGGVLGTELDPAVCGFSESGSGWRNPLRPWCEEYPALGARPLPLTVGIDCFAVSGVLPTSFEISLNQLDEKFTQQFPVTVVCPRCGDGIKTIGEACDPGQQDGDIGYNAACTRNCELP